MRLRLSIMAHIIATADRHIYHLLLFCAHTHTHCSDLQITTPPSVFTCYYYVEKRTKPLLRAAAWPLDVCPLTTAWPEHNEPRIGGHGQ